MGHDLNAFARAVSARPAGMRLALLLVAILAARAGAAEIPQWEIENKKCLMCHGGTEIGTMTGAERMLKVAPATQPSARPAVQGPRPGLYVPPAGLPGAHGKMKCVSCHKGADEKLPHVADLPPATCNAACHSQESSGYLQGAHASAAAQGKDAPTCSTCHGAHNILPKADRQSRLHPLNIIKVCGDCHTQHSPKESNGKNRVEMYLDSVHGRALSSGTLAAAATCADCHGSHLVLPAKDAKSHVNRSNIAETCGKCHIGVSETYEKSIHGTLLAAGRKDAPVCSDCHTSHAITRTDTPEFKLDIVNECGTCHDKPREGSKSTVTLYETYRKSYHGQVTALGFVRGARCSDCHGAHDILRIEDPDSRLNAANRVGACKQCHPKANAQFAKFEPHADMHDAERYPVLHGVWLYFVIMMSFAFGFFGLHSVFWFVRSIIERIRKGPPAYHHGKGFSIQRFNRVDRINHAFVIISFFGLTITGLPLLYAEKEWARTLAWMLGGVKQAGILHRFFAIILIANFVVHFFGIVNRIRKYGLFKLVFGPTTMLPRIKDVKDCLGMWRWFFRGGQKPRFDRWTYWEKFDYVAEVGGSGIIGLSGLMLWFPEFFSNYLPGWMFNVATIVHGYEALLAIGFIFTIHFFNAHLRLEKFPTDDVMFTGRLPEEEFKEERAEEYERLVAEGRLEELRVPPPPSWYRQFAVLMGITAMAIGTTLVVLIVLAGLGIM